MMASPIPQYFQESYSVPPPRNEKQSALETSKEILQESALQFQKSSSQSIDRLETQLSKLVNIYKNEETLSSQPLTNPDISNSIDLTQD